VFLGTRFLVLLLSLVFLGTSLVAEQRPTPKAAATKLTLFRTNTFLLDRKEELQRLVSFCERNKRQHQVARKSWIQQREIILSTNFVQILPEPTLALLYQEPRAAQKKIGRCWQTMAELAQKLSEDPQAASVRQNLFEVAAALENNFRSPQPERITSFTVPWFFLKYSGNHIGGFSVKSESRAVRCANTTTFWEPRRSPAEQDLYAGFGRSSLPEWEKVTWEYSGPKTSYGGCPGFTLRSGGVEVKIKFAETISEPFTARIFHAMGYHVDPTDHARELRIRYDRRLLREFHMRYPLRTDLAFLGVLPAGYLELQKRHDPLAFIQCGVLKNGDIVPREELRERLFINPSRKFPATDPNNFRTEFENQLELLVTVAANVQPEDNSWHSLGPWTFDGLNHEDVAELRAAGLLSAWLGWFDSRFENNRLKIQRSEKGAIRLAHFFSDLGGGLGRAEGVFTRACELPEEFPATFTSREGDQFKILHFAPIEKTIAFEKMTAHEARWMAEKIKSISPQQILDALTAAGCSPIQARLFQEKLLSRQEKMLRDLAIEPVK
jgi:hypothetical protein